MVEKQMKTFNVGDTRYIVTDAEAREDIEELQDALSPLEVAAESEDVGKALKAKTISGGKVTEYELGYAAIIDDTLSVAGEAADAKETGDAIADLDTAKVNKPTTSPNGTSGQLLRTNGDGTTTWVDQGLPTDEQTADAVEAWLDAHPEATTTVQDGAITKAKLDSNLQNTVDDVADLKSQLQNDAGLTVGPYIDALNEKILTLKKSINILDTSATGWEQGGISSTGSVVVTGYELYSVSPYIQVMPGLAIVSTRQGTADSRILFSISVGFYDGDKNFISPRQTSVSSVSVPVGAVYMRISGPTAYLQTSPGTYKPMLNYGSTIVDYEPFYVPYYEVVENWPNDSGEIVCWGDSLTYGSGSTSGNSYPDKLAQMTGKVVHKCGFPADSSDEIAGYQGSMPLVIAPVTIPASGSVNVDVYAYNRDPNGYPFGYPTIDAGNINPVTIAGIEGTLDLSAAGANASNRTFSFTRSASGNAVTLIDYTEVMPKNAIDRCKDIQIIWVGSNGGWDLTNSTLISQIRNMVEFQQSILKKYIVVGFAAGIEVSYAVSFARDATLAFGNHFIDMRDYLVRCGLAENGITPTEQDTQDIEDGKVPSSLRINPYTHTVDSVHLNDAGYNSVASAVYTRGKILGYWS